ncbi:PAAR-like protein [Sungkyunkwania multivorans]|uniref:PAAR-like protein n=1 Tax=Sungkyunkwania multivorans TaxID=1173618 RepID=A0ABW3CTX3_9FLAO
MSKGLKGTLVCQGAICSCTLAASPATMKVVTQQKHYVNDASGGSKAIATDKESTVASLNFGVCRPGTKRAHPCGAQLKWNGMYTAVELENGGSPLLDSSSAKCGADSGTVSVVHHGQTSAVGGQQVNAADEAVQEQLNPLVNFGVVKRKIEVKNASSI